MARFSKTFSNRLVRCRACGKLTHSSIDGYRDICLCRPCLEDSGEENTWSDHGCPECGSSGYSLNYFKKVVDGKEVEVLHDIACHQCGYRYVSGHAQEHKDGQE